MRRILICAGDITLEALLVIVIRRMGHETETLGLAPHRMPVRADLLVVDPSAPHGLAWARTLRRFDPELPVVTIGLEPAHGRELGFPPDVVVPKPFSLDQLRSAVDKALKP